MEKTQIIFYIKCHYNNYGIPKYDIYNNNFPNYSKRDINKFFLYQEMHYITNKFEHNKIEVFFKMV